MSSVDSSSSSSEACIVRFSIWRTFKRHIPHFLLTILVDVVLPILVYFILQKHIKPVYALLIAGVPPFIMVIGKAISSRTFDALGFLVFLGFIISGTVAIITRNPVVLLLEKSLVTGFTSIIFGISLIPFRCCDNRCRIRPLAYYFYQDLVPTTAAQLGLPSNIFLDERDVLISKSSDKKEVAKVYSWLYDQCSSFRSSCYRITSIWAIGLLLEFLGRLSLILVHLSVNKLVIYGNVILTSMTILCIILTIISITKERKQTIRFIELWTKDHLDLQ